MYYVYVLSSDKSLYIGYSSDLKERLQYHNDGKVASTKRARPWSLVYYEAYTGKSFAQNRELKLKQRGRVWQELKKRIGIVPKVVLGHGVPIEE